MRNWLQNRGCLSIIPHRVEYDLPMGGSAYGSPRNSMISLSTDDGIPETGPVSCVTSRKRCYERDLQNVHILGLFHSLENKNYNGFT